MLIQCSSVLCLEEEQQTHSEKGDEVGDEKERFARSNRESGDESLSRGKNESSDGI